jgi:hypothetical protein
LLLHLASFRRRSPHRSRADSSIRTVPNTVSLGVLARREGPRENQSFPPRPNGSGSASPNRCRHSGLRAGDPRGHSGWPVTPSSSLHPGSPSIRRVPVPTRWPPAPHPLGARGATRPRAGFRARGRSPSESTPAPGADGSDRVVRSRSLSDLYLRRVHETRIPPLQRATVVACRTRTLGLASRNPGRLRPPPEMQWARGRRARHAAYLRPHGNRSVNPPRR